jgi:hypothetical protein
MSNSGEMFAVAHAEAAIAHVKRKMKTKIKLFIASRSFLARHEEQAIFGSPVACSHAIN